MLRGEVWWANLFERIKVFVRCLYGDCSRRKICPREICPRQICFREIGFVEKLKMGQRHCPRPLVCSSISITFGGTITRGFHTSGGVIKSAFSKLARTKLAFSKSVVNNLAPLKSARSRIAPCNFAPCSNAPESFAPTR